MKVFLASVSLEFPLAAYCLGATLARRLETEVVLYDVDWAAISAYSSKNSEIWRLIAALDRARPDVLGLSVYLWSHIVCRELIAIVRPLFPSLLIVVGGPEIATPANAESWIAEGEADVAIRGPGEIAFERVVARRATGSSLSGIPGVSFREGANVQHLAPTATAGDLGALPSPFLTGLVPDDAFDRSTGLGRYPRALIETYRGCYMQCAYCQWGNGDASRQPFDEARVKGELSWLIARDVAQVFIVDAMFGFKKRLALALLEFIVEEKRRYGAMTRFSVYHNQDFNDPRLFALYREAGVNVEIDLQSTNPVVLKRLGRERWTTEVFERQLARVRDAGTPTTGATDLIIGIPGDDLASFQNSVDFLLRRRLRVNLYQASILPNTQWARNVAVEGVTASPIAPRAIFKTASFPLRDMIAARLIGHGADLFNSFPCTADILWRGWFDRPVELCREVGELVFTRYGAMYGESHQYAGSLTRWLEALPEIIAALCPDERAREILSDLAAFEGTCAAMRWSRRPRAAPSVWQPEGGNWGEARPRFCAEKVERIVLRWPVEALSAAWSVSPNLDQLARLSPLPHAALITGSGGHVAIDLGVTDRLLQRLNGFFTVDAALETLPAHLPDRGPLWLLLSTLAELGVLEPDAEAAMIRGSAA